MCNYLLRTKFIYEHLFCSLKGIRAHQKFHFVGRKSTSLSNLASSLAASIKSDLNSRKTFQKAAEDFMYQKITRKLQLSIFNKFCFLSYPDFSLSFGLCMRAPQFAIFVILNKQTLLQLPWHSYKNYQQDKLFFRGILQSGQTIEINIHF